MRVKRIPNVFEIKLACILISFSNEWILILINNKRILHERKRETNDVDVDDFEDSFENNTHEWRIPISCCIISNRKKYKIFINGTTTPSQK